MNVEVFFKEQIGPLGYRWRIEMQKAGATGTSETFTEAPDDLFYNLGKAVTGWEKVLFGLQRTPSFDMEINVLSARSVTGLADILLEPMVSGVGDLDRGLLGGTRSIDAGTVWRVSCDQGAGYASGSENLRNAIVGIYVQRPIPSRKHRVIRSGHSSSSHRMKVTLVDAVRSALETVRPDDVSAAMVDDAAPPKGPHSVEFDRIYYDEAADLILARFEKQEYNPQQWRRYYVLDDLYATVQDLVQQALRIILRTTSVSLAFVGYSVSGDDAPFQHWRFASQNYLPNGQPVYNDPTKYFIGTSHLANDPTDTSTLVGGVFADVFEDNPQSLYRFRSMWDFVKVAAPGWATMASIKYGSRFVASLTFDVVARESAQSIDDEDLPKQVDFEEPGNIVARAIGAIPGLEGDDQSEYRSATYFGGDIEDDQDENVRMLFHNLPRIGDRTNAFHSYYFSSGLSTHEYRRMSVITTDYLGIYSEDITPWKLFYFDRPEAPLDGGGTKFLLDKEMPIRISEWCDAAYGLGGADRVYSGSGGPLPTIPIRPTDSKSATVAIDSWWASLVAHSLDVQRNASIPQVVCELVALVFSDSRQTLYSDLVLPFVSAVSTARLGKTADLGTGGTASTFLPPGETYLDHLSTAARILELAVLIGEDRVTGQFLRVEKP